MTMSKKDYELLAKTLHSVKPTASPVLGIAITQWEDTVLAISVALLKQNPRFKEAQFLKACNDGLPDKE